MLDGDWSSDVCSSDLAGKIKLKKDLDVTAACKAINSLEVELKQRFPEIKWSFMEPDIA
jgi:hypothetical protein